MTTFYSMFRYEGEAIPNDYEPPDELPNHITTDKSKNAISDMQSMVDMHVFSTEKQLNRIFRKFTMIVDEVDTDEVSFAGHLFGVQMFKLLRAKKQFEASQYTLEVKPGLCQETEIFMPASTIKHDLFDPLAVFVQHMSAPALGFVDDDEASSVNYTKVRKDLRKKGYSKSVGMFNRSLGRSQKKLKTPKKFINGTFNFSASLFVHTLSTGSNPDQLTGLKSNLKLKGASSNEDIVASLDGNAGKEFVFYLNPGDSLCLNFCLLPSDLPNSIEAYGRIFVRCIQETS